MPGLASPDRETREFNLGLFKRGCETAEVLGAEGVLDNAPLPPYVFPKDIPIVRHYEDEVLMKASFPPNLEWATYWQELVETFRTACDIAAENSWPMVSTWWGRPTAGWWRWRSH